MKFKNFDELLNVKIICDTKDKAKQLLKEAKKQGYRWNSGKDLKYDYWDDLKENTYYEFWDDKTVTYGNRMLYGENGFIYFEEILNDMQEEEEDIIDKQNIIDLVNELEKLKQQRDKVDKDIDELIEVIERSIREFSNK